jgi:hypothetical protein
MTLVDWLYAVISLGDAAILFIWGLIDLRAEHRRDALFLMAIGLCSLTAYGIGHYKEGALNAQVAQASKDAATAKLEEKRIEGENLKLAASIEGERTQRVALEKTLQEFKLVSQLSDEALAGSSNSYDLLVDRSHEKSEIGQRAGERVKYITRDLAYYEQPPGLVLALDLSANVNGKQVRILEAPTADLFRFLQDETITNNTRFSIINDLSKKPVVEVNKSALETLKTSHYLPAIAATTTLLRRLHNKAVPFMDKAGWIAYLTGHKESIQSRNTQP